MPPKKTNSRKRDALRQQGCLNPHPEQVADPLFQQSDFFDAHDLVQVKYEMLRRVQIDQQPVSQAAAAASAQADSPGAGICATDPIRTAIVGHRPSRSRDSRTLWCSRSPTEYRARCGATGKKTTLNQRPVVTSAEPVAQGTGATLLAAYEDLRQPVLGGLSSKGLGMSLLLGQGMAVWMKACFATLAVPSN